MDKWEEFHKGQLDGESQYVQAFNAGVIAFLGSPKQDNARRNDPFSVIERGGNVTGELTRIFDEFSLPVPEYAAFKSHVGMAGSLGAYMQSILKEILPILLNAEGTALNQNIIDGINANDSKNYNKLMNAADGNEELVAEQFVRGVIIGYAQRLLGKIPPGKEMEFMSNYMTAFGNLAANATVKGVQQKSGKSITLEELKAAVSGLFDLVLENKINEEYLIKAFGTMHDRLEEAEGWLNPDNDDVAAAMGEDIQIQKALACYKEAVEALATIDKPKKPEEVSLYAALRSYIGPYVSSKKAAKVQKENAAKKLYKSFTEMNDYVTKGAGKLIDDTEPKGPDATEPKGLDAAEPKGPDDVEPKGLDDTDSEGLDDTDSEELDVTGPKGPGM